MILKRPGRLRRERAITAVPSPESFSLLGSAPMRFWKNGVRIAAGHVDWPCLRIKPAPTFSKQGYLQANVEVYGGPILSTFFDRPLSIAGKITLRSQDILHPEVRYIDLKKPVCIVPNLAIHMNRQVNDGVAIDKQLHMMPVLGMIQEQLNEHDRLLEYIAAHENVAYDDILDYELCLYNMDEPAFVGLSDEFYPLPVWMILRPYLPLFTALSTVHRTMLFPWAHFLTMKRSAAIQSRERMR